MISHLSIELDLRKLVLITLNSTIYLRTVINTIFNYDFTKENKTSDWGEEKSNTRTIGGVEYAKGAFFYVRNWKFTNKHVIYTGPEPVGKMAT